MSRSGRRPGKQDTRGVILECARELFAAHGYDGASIRQIAAAADVDPALVHHYFGSKEQLLEAALDVPIEPTELIPKVFAEGVEEAPERLVRIFTGVWEDPVTGPAMVTFLRTAVSQGATSRLVGDFFATRIRKAVIEELGGRIPAEDAPLRVSLVASQLFGLALARYVLEFEPLARADNETVVGAVAPNIRRYLFGELTAADQATGEGR